MIANTIQSMAVAAGARAIETHEERLMVLASVPPDDLLGVIDAMSPETRPDWMSTLALIGTLDLGVMLADAKDTVEAQDAVKQWVSNSRIFLRMVPAASSIVTLPNVRVAVVDASSGIRAEFMAAAQRLSSEATKVRASDFVQMPPIDSVMALEDPMVRELSHWASVACMLGMPTTLRLLLDAFPEAMSASTTIVVPVLEVLSSNQQPDDLMGVSSPAHQQVSPFVCALHASSLPCMAVISEKRAALGLPGDPPAVVVDMTQRQPALTWSQSFHGVAVSSTPDAFAHAMRTAIEGLAVPDKTIPDRLIAVGKKDVSNFEACLLLGLDIFQKASPKFRVEALFIAMMHLPKLVPEMLKNVPWSGIEKNIANDKSLILRIANATPWKGKSEAQERREDSLAKLITQAEKDSKTEVLLSTFVGEDSRPLCIEPVSTLSQRGWTKTLKAFFDHGVDPKASPLPGMFSLLALANQQNHPSFPMIQSYVARGRALDVLAEIADSPRLAVD